MSIDFRYSAIVLIAIAGALARPSSTRANVPTSRAGWRDSIRSLNEQNFHHSA